jgi:serine/threonine protein kinase/Flp pilus assembly protein TadD
MPTKAPSLDTIFCAAIEIASPESRAEFLAAACGDDAELRHRLEKLVTAHFQAGGFLERPAVATDPDGTAGWYAAGPAHEPGTIIGPYKLMEQIGEGGMGIVYVAEQTQPVRRKVALKVIKPGMDSKQVIARFEAERQALALMDHANIARILDAGATESGRPYFVMELVRGMPITEYCDQNRLSLDDRLDLFVLVCQAVGHAHQKGIIHRDLKPSNVLITLHDGTPVPKVIDFGIAKATGSAAGGLTDRTLYTGFAELIGTPMYLSPEQAELSGIDVDTRSDIYSLGVLLYELLTGTTPFDQATFRRAALDEVRRIIREQEPPKPSTRLSKDEGRRMKDETKRAGRYRFWPYSSFSLHPSSFQELDWITMKALEKDRRRRYETAGAFAADIARYRKHQPVEAGPPSAWYRARKFARRNRVILTTTILVALALIACTTASVWQAILARRARTEAVSQRDRARKAVDEMYTEVAQKWLSQQPQLELLQREFLLKALAFYQDFARERGSDPDARRGAGRAETNAADILRTLGEHPGAEGAYRRAVEIQEALVDQLPKVPEYRMDLANTYSRLTILLHDTGQLAESERTNSRSRELWEAIVAELPKVPDYRRNVARTYNLQGYGLRDRGRLVEAERSVRRAIELLEALVTEFPKDSGCRNDLGDVYSHLGVLQIQSGHAAEAERAWRRAIVLKEALAAEFPEVSRGPRYRASLALDHTDIGRVLLGVPDRFGEAERALRRALELQQPLVAEFPKAPEYRKHLAGSYDNLGAILLKVPGRVAEAERALRTAIELQEVLVAQSPDVADHRSDLGGSLNNLGEIQKDRGNLAAALSLYQRAIDHQRAALRANPSNPKYREFLRNHYCGLADVFGRQGDHAAAAQAAEESARISRNRAHDCAFFAGYLLQCQRLAETDSRLSAADRQAKVRDYADRALTMLKEGVEAAGDDPEALNGLAWFLATCADARLRDAARAVELARKALEKTPKAGAIWNTLGVAEYRAGAWHEAIEALSRSMQLTAGGSAGDWFFLAMACSQKGDKERARSWYDKAIRWMEQNKSQDAELVRFRAEAAALLHMKEPDALMPNGVAAFAGG